MSRPMIVSFPDASQRDAAPLDTASSDSQSASLVGGKGLSLIHMTELGLPVPSGSVLTTEFFAPWIEIIQSSESWKALMKATEEQRAGLCSELKELCADLPLSNPQQEVLDGWREGLSTELREGLFAVRSSSPEEDLDAASFAGGYETCLGIGLDGLESALRRVFASCWDERVLVYKREKGFDPFSVRFAAIIQRQIASDVAGVGFSLNPLTNDYDEALIEANWGLGESVVSGAASPDRWVVDKVDLKVVDQELGSKKTSIWLEREGGTSEKQTHRSDEPCLDDETVKELTELIQRVEVAYGRPMDIEWAAADGRLFLLQARPITTYVPLPPEMQTRPGEPRRLYADGALSKGMTTNEPLSVIELDWGKKFLHPFLHRLVGMEGTPEDNIVFFAGARLYLNLSHMLCLASPEDLAKGSRANDQLMADIQAGIDADRYRSAERPHWMRLRNLGPFLGLLWQWKGIVWNSLRPFWAKDKAHADYLRQVAEYEQYFKEEVDLNQSLTELQESASRTMLDYVFGVACPALTAGLSALALVDRLGKKKPELRKLTDRLQVGFDGNVVVEMGIAQYRLAHLLPPSEFEDLSQLEIKLQDRSLPSAFLEAWDRFVELYGWRGPSEMDQANPRYADDPMLALRQMSYMVGSDFDPEATHQHNMESRRQAFKELMDRSGWFRRWWLGKAHALIERFAGARDTPKHHLVLFGYTLRRRMLIEGDLLVAGGRLDRREHVFDLTHEDLRDAAADPSLDLRRIRAENTRFINQLKAQVKLFPQVIDSRGRILRPPAKEHQPGEMPGTGVSPGVARGPVKVLHRPDEKPIEPGDILVAYTTDPGWTPLFVNAAAVVLEVGGVLQHGAVVAREYGKPCVVGIDRVVSRLRDGQVVEVDGNTGVLRLLDG